MGQFAKWAAEQAEAWKDRAKEQVSRFRQHMPLTQEETAALAQQLIRERAQMAYELGRRIRLSQTDSGDAKEFPFLSDSQPRSERFDVLQGVGEAPGREIVIPLKKHSSSAVGGMMESVRDRLEQAYRDLQLEKARGMAATSDPASLPWFYPAQVKALPKAFMSGYKSVEDELGAKKMQEVDAQLADAKAQFESALAGERGVRKVGSFEGFLDLVSSEHEKRSSVLDEGDLSKLLGYYLAAASAMHTGADTMAYNWMAKRDPRRLQAKALEAAIKRRARETPQPVLVTPEDSSSATSTTDESLLGALPQGPDSKPESSEIR